MQEWIESLIQWLLEITQFSSYFILFVTIPLSVIQGVLTIFPFITILILHISTFGLVQGLAISWMVGSVSSIVCFILFRTIFYENVKKRLVKRLIRYEKWQKYMDDYGIYMVILLRSIPVIPNNIGTFMAAVSPIRLKTYLWATSLGTLSHIWLIGLISSSIFIPDSNLFWEWIKYAVFCVILCSFFLIKLNKNKAQEMKKNTAGRF